MDSKSAWEQARGERMNYVEELRQIIKCYGYADANEAAATHKELCRLLGARLTKIGENAHLAMDFLRGPRSAELERLMRNMKDDVEIFRDEVVSSYIEWKNPRVDTIREIIEKDAQIVRSSASIIRLTDQLREASLSKALKVMEEHATAIIEQLSKLSYLFSDRERLCR